MGYGDDEQHRSAPVGAAKLAKLLLRGALAWVVPVDSGKPSEAPVVRARSLWQAPALHALLHQCLAFLLICICLIVLEIHSEVQIRLGIAVWLQGLLAAAISYWRRLAPWWLLIQLLFPVALLVTYGMQLPPIFFLLLFLGFLTLYWSTFRTQVPYYPSNRSVWQAVAALLPPDQPLRFIDIGSGFGGLVMELAATRREGAFTGVELAPLPWLISKWRARLQRSRAKFIRGDYMHLDFSDYDVIFAYLSPAAMAALWEKAHTEMRPGSLLLSYEFVIPDQVPDIVIAPSPDGPMLHGWRM